MEEQIVVGGKVTASTSAAAGVWDGGGGSSGSDKSSGSTPIPMEIRPDEETVVPPVEETAAGTEPAETETLSGDVAVVGIFGEEEATEESIEITQATETVAVEAPVAADLTGSNGGPGIGIIAAAVLAVALVLGIVIGKRKKKA